MTEKKSKSTTKRKQNPDGMIKTQEVKVEAPVTITIWTVLESDEFEKHLTDTMHSLVASRGEAIMKLQPGTRLKQTPIGHVLDQYSSNLSNMVIEFIKILGNKSKQPAAIRKVICQIIEPLVKQTAKELVTKNSKN